MDLVILQLVTGVQFERALCCFGMTLRGTYLTLCALYSPTRKLWNNALET